MKRQGGKDTWKFLKTFKIYLVFRKYLIKSYYMHVHMNGNINYRNLNFQA